MRQKKNLKNFRLQPTYALFLTCSASSRHCPLPLPPPLACPAHGFVLHPTFSPTEPTSEPHNPFISPQVAAHSLRCCHAPSIHNRSHGSNPLGARRRQGQFCLSSLFLALSFRRQLVPRSDVARSFFLVPASPSLPAARPPSSALCGLAAGGWKRWECARRELRLSRLDRVSLLLRPPSPRRRRSRSLFTRSREPGNPFLHVPRIQTSAATNRPVCQPVAVHVPRKIAQSLLSNALSTMLIFSLPAELLQG